MDKYTVDLDQVLNDFEYSELTETNHTKASTSNESRHKNCNAKHSINNVFTSLNEYLNTDISGKSKLIETNNLSDNKKLANLPNNVKKEADFDANLREKCKDDTNKLINNPEVIKALNYIENLQEIDEIDEHRMSLEDILKLADFADDEEDEESEEESLENTKVETIFEEELISDEEGAVLEQNDVKEEAGMSEVSAEINDLCKNIEDMSKILNDLPKNQKLLDPIIVENEQFLGKTEGEFENRENETRDLEIEARLLELGSLNIKQEAINMEKVIGSVEENFKIVEKNVEFIEKETKDLEDKFKQKCDDTKLIEEGLIKESKLEENDAIKVSFPKAVVGFDTSFEMDDCELNKYLESLEEELERKAFLEDKKIVEKSKSVEEKPQMRQLVAATATERPNSLELTEKKRAINLIGNPGSTPYNNVYVSKEIPAVAQPMEEKEDESASISPTFSEASTDSIRSTESTDTDGLSGVAGALINAGCEKEVETPSSCATVVPVEEEEDVEGAVGLVGDRLPLETHAELGQDEEIMDDEYWLGKRPPMWIPDSDALNCLHCDMKFTVLKRRHHCRACGYVLCSKCCSVRYHLSYLDMESRVCTKCYDILIIKECASTNADALAPPTHTQPNPNNPMEYCSQIPPLQQMNNGGDAPPTVMVPVGVLKRTGSTKTKHNKSVMFCDGIRPGSDLTNLDNDFNYNETRSLAKKPQVLAKIARVANPVEANTQGFIPEAENALPPTCTSVKTEITYADCANSAALVDKLKVEQLTFALQRNLLVHVKIINMDCCINKEAWCFTTEGLITVGQDEIIILLETSNNEQTLPKDIFLHLNNIYIDALKGTTVTELGISMHTNTNFLDSKNHAGFLYIRPSFQCLQNVIIPKEPYLIGLLIHRWETPWAKIFPLRLVLRLGAEYRYYPSPLISTRNRDSVFVEIGHTIINLLADFRNFSFTLPNIRGLSIHMEDKNTTVMLPVNRYDQVMKCLSNSSDHILAFGGNFSALADSHLVCIQDLHGNNENSYTTHAINIQNKPRKVTGASFIVFNGALKSSSGLTAKSSIVEDGLMIQIPSEQMVHLRESLRNMKNHTIQCGCVSAATSDECVSIVWGEPDINFNMGVKSSVDEALSLCGVPSIRVHNGKDYVCNSGSRLLRWTEVFLIQNGEEGAAATRTTQEPVDISKIAETIAKATCQGLVKYLDLLATNNFYKIGIRTTLHIENVSYSAGSNGVKLPPIYMKSLDNELVPVLHRITSNNLGENAIILELIFRILNV